MCSSDLAQEEEDDATVPVDISGLVQAIIVDASGGDATAGTAGESPKSNPATFLENSTVCEKPVPTPSLGGLAPRGTVPWRIRITDEPRAVQGMAPAPPIPPVRPGRMVKLGGSRAAELLREHPQRASGPGGSFRSQTESLILAQDERWRRA